MTLNQGYAFRTVLGPNCKGHTALSFLSVHFTHSTQVEWQSRFEAGEIQLDDLPANGQESLRAGCILTWNRPAWIEESTPQKFTIIHQDPSLLIVDKPSGLPTLPGGGFYLNTLLSLVRRDFPTANPVHRLGRATSGLVLFAFDSLSASQLSKQWITMKKQYQALASGVASDDDYDIRSRIGLMDHPRLGRVHAASNSGKSARSVARVVSRRTNATLFEVDLHTGRPHQIRIHLATIGHPLVGDPLYAPGGHPHGNAPGLPGEGGYWLHAKRLVLRHPTTQDLLDLHSPLPELLRPE